MNKQDILLKTDEGIFSYRVAGILIRDGKVLLQPVSNHYKRKIDELV